MENINEKHTKTHPFNVFSACMQNLFYWFGFVGLKMDKHTYWMCGYTIMWLVSIK
jgi:hypothetical protein